MFLVSAMRMLASGGITERIACGSTMSRSICPNVMPSERAASAWPRSTALIPERTASHTNAAV